MSALWKCKSCEKKVAAPFNKVLNLKKHLYEHISDNLFIRKWLELYNSRSSLNQTGISENQMNLIKFFLTSNTSLEQIENPYLLKLLDPVLKLNSPDHFREEILKSTSILHNLIENKLCNASSITLITDIWTDKQNREYIAAKCVFPNYKKELLIIALERMSFGHNAYNIKKKVEQMINNYTEFDKSKIHGLKN